MRSNLELRRAFANSDHGFVHFVRRTRKALRHISVPAPRVITLPIRLVYTAIRGAWYVGFRVLVAEPIFKSYCAKVGKRFRADAYVHWVQGHGRIIIGDDVTIEGKCSIGFGSRFSDSPTLTIGDRTGIGHGCVLVTAREITIGNDCRIAAFSTFRDSPGHPLDPEARRRGDPPHEDVVRPVVLEDNVWIGANVIVNPGVRIGEGSVVASGSVVSSSVPPFSLVAGNPARRIGVVGAAAAANSSPEA